MLRWLGAAGFALVLSTAGKSRASELAVPVETETRLPERLSWRPEWRRSDAWDYALTLTAFAGYAATELLPQPEAEPDWDKPILFDNWVRNALVGRSVSERKWAAVGSNVVLSFSIGHVVADATLVASLHHHAPDVGWQMLVMDSEAYSISLLLNGVAKRITSRARPYVESCKKNPNYDPSCSNSDPFASFYSGHSAITATSAGLLCAQHTHLALYGGDWDTAACVNGVVVTTLTAALRIIADRHWATDVLTGHLLGFSSGYFVPELLHFRGGAPSSDSARLIGVFPGLNDSGGVSLNAIGVF
jgi:membrane-associated phospholipid phosphatase